MLAITLLLFFSCAMIVGYFVLPDVYTRVNIMSERRKQKFSSKMDHLLPRQKASSMSRLFLFTPILFSVAFYFLFPEEFRNLGLIVGFTGGIIFPSFYIRVLTEKTRNKFNRQLVDALMIMSSSFRGGLSLVQALEAVVEEMPDPINREIGTVLGENKMGVSLEEALDHLYQRMPSVALQQMITSILLARETGGNLPAIFNRIVNNIREARKIQENIKTLTIQGKIQGIVMSLLPIAFGFIVYATNPRIFNHMFTSKLGRALLTYAVISEIIGALLIWRISTNTDY